MIFFKIKKDEKKDITNIKNSFNQTLNKNISNNQQQTNNNSTTANNINNINANLNNNLNNTQNNPTNLNLNTPPPLTQNIPENNSKNFINPFANNLNNANTINNSSNINDNNNLFNNLSTNKLNQNNQINTYQNNPSPINQNETANLFNNYNTQNLNSLDNLNKNYLTKDEAIDMIEEIIEKAIDEKIGIAIKNIKKVIDWKEVIEEKVTMLKGEIVNLKENFNELEKRLLGKISDYDKNILDVNSEIKALEKVFQKITPTLVNNVNELSKIAKELKQQKIEKEGK